jgi:hypothetical protein
MRFIALFSILLVIVTLSAQDQVLSRQQGTLRDWTMQEEIHGRLESSPRRQLRHGPYVGHLRTMVVYLRLNGITPPASQRP